MWPAITDEPTAPGRGLPVYQPATEVLVGTCSVPCAVTPSLISVVWTSMAGMVRATGRAAGWPAEEPGAVAAAPDGAVPSVATGWGMSAGLPRTPTRPTVPMIAAISPPPTAASVHGLRGSPMRGRPGRA